ncbi:hypothetical protein AAE478_006799 [Parahypoxylon ruwenzoriense]
MTTRPRTKVKSGCRTCKARKVKCDEGRPVCSRCVSTGRICEGYGIWGGGGNQYGHRSIDPKAGKVPKSYCVPTLIKTVSKEESRCLEWFTYRTAMKLPGAFKFGFWDTLVFQAISTEPAVLHAVLALSSAHRREGLPVDISLKEHIPDEQEQFTLQHYSRAITHLQPHFLTKNRASIRVALLTCLVFIIMEYLRGRYRVGNTHLQNGLKLLNEFQTQTTTVGSHKILRKPWCDSVDAWIIEAFVRFDVQAKLLGCGSQYLYTIPEDSADDTPIIESAFRSIYQARKHIDRLFSQIFYLNNECRRQMLLQGRVNPTSLLDRQQRIITGLASWFRIFQVSKIYLRTNEVSAGIVAYPLLHLYYNMAEIMADTCLWPADELKFDAHTQTFTFMMDQLRYIRDLASSPALFDALHFSNMSGSIIDLGALPLVYYIVLKCRVHRIRHDAIEFLSLLPHKEGIWDGPLMAAIAKEVVIIEESGFYNSSNITDENDFTQFPILPESYRLHDVEVELPEDYGGKAMLKCRRGANHFDWEVLTREFVYDIQTQSWVNKEKK